MTQNNTVTNLHLTTTDAGNLDTLARRAPATDDLLQLADWLADHGAAHLSQIERIELAERLITRRRFITAAGGLLGAAALGACGTGEPTTGPTSSGDTRVIETIMGEVEIPSDPQRVVTLHDQNVLLPLWELGFHNIVGSAGVLNADGTHLFRGMQDFDTSGVEFFGDYVAPNPELIAALQPDLIVGNQFQINNYELYSDIAPTVLIEILTRSLEDSAADFAELVGREAALAELETQYETRIAELRDRLGDPSEITVSIIEWGAGGGAEEGQFYVDYGGAVITVLHDIGFDRPAKQIDVSERTYYSIELLPEHDGDVLLRPYFMPGEIDDDEAMIFKDSPVWEQLNAVQQGQAFDVPGNRWFGAAYTPRFNVLNDLEKLLVDQDIDTSWEPTE